MKISEKVIKDKQLTLKLIEENIPYTDLKKLREALQKKSDEINSLPTKTVKQNEVYKEKMYHMGRWWSDEMRELGYKIMDTYDFVSRATSSPD